MKEIRNTPILEHFKQWKLVVPNHFNQSMMLACSRRLNILTLKASLSILCQYHDMLRAVWDGNKLQLREAIVPNLFHLEEHDLKKSSNVAEDMLPQCEALQASIDLSKGPMMRVAVFHLPERDAVLMVIHHLVVDGVSWRIIAEDLNKIYATLSQGKLSVGLPKRKCNFGQYAQAINDYAKSTDLQREEHFWQEVVNRVRTVKTDISKQTNEVCYATFELDAGNTRQLISEGNKRYGADINALLLTALSRAWREVMHQDVLPLAQEGHGRESFGGQILPLDRLVGWFTTIYPVALQYVDADLPTQVAATQSMLQAIPNKGFGYGVLRYIGNTETLQCEPLMTFNYLGSFDEAVNDSVFSFDHTLPQGSSVSSQNHPDTPLSINCAVTDGKLCGALTYDRGLMDDAMAQALCESYVSKIKLLNQ